VLLSDSDMRTVAWPTHARTTHYLERRKKTMIHRIYGSEMKGTEVWRKSSKSAVK
jgi:hypothetical protein